MGKIGWPFAANPLTITISRVAHTKQIQSRKALTLGLT